MIFQKLTLGISKISITFVFEKSCLLISLLNIQMGLTTVAFVPYLVVPGLSKDLHFLEILPLFAIRRF